MAGVILFLFAYSFINKNSSFPTVDGESPLPALWLISDIVTISFLMHLKNLHWSTGRVSEWSRLISAGKEVRQLVSTPSKVRGRQSWQKQQQRAASQALTNAPPFLLSLPTHGAVWGDLFSSIDGGFLRSLLYPHFSRLQLDARVCIKV